MRFRKVVVAAVILTLVSAGALAVYGIAEDARGEAAQSTVERADSLAVEPDLRQTLVSDTDHDPTGYGDGVTVEYNGTEWDPAGNYTYDPADGALEFTRDEPGEANITYEYDVPADQAGDDQLQTLTEGYGNVLVLGAMFCFVVLFLFVGGFAATKLGVGRGRSPRGR